MVRQMSIRARMLAAMLLVSLVPLAILGGQGYHCARQAIIELTDDRIVSVLRGRETVIQEWFQERADDMRTLAALPSLDGADRPDLRAALDAVHQYNAAFDALAVYNTDWQLVAAVSGDGHAPDVAGLPAFRDAVASASTPFFGAPHVHENGALGLHVGYPIRDTTGRGVGYLVGNLDVTRSLTPLLQDRSGLGESGRVYLTDRSGTILTQPSPRGSDLQKANPEVIAVGAGAVPHVMAYRDTTGAVVLGASAVLPHGDWVLVAEINRSEALAWLRILLWRLAGTVSVTVVLVGLIAFWMARIVGRPLKELLAVAQRIRAGETSKRVPPLSGAEAEEVRVAVNLMLDELQRQQRQLVKSATLASVGELTASIVHEMRNPLSSIKINSQAFQRALRDDVKYAELSDINLQQVERLDRMLTDLLNYGRPVELHLDPTALRELCATCVESVAPLARDKGVSLDLRGGGLAATALVDREQMRRALTNLIQNAVDATPEGGLVVVSAIDRRAQEGPLTIEVSDTGAGLSGSALERAFEPFFTTKPHGTGLGLANVAKIVELHGGTVAARNGTEGGAVFTIELPHQA